MGITANGPKNAVGVEDRVVRAIWLDLIMQFCMRASTTSVAYVALSFQCRVDMRGGAYGG